MMQVPQRKKKKVALPKILTYFMLGFMHRAKLLGRVQGVVVHARRETSGSSTRGKETVTVIHQEQKEKKH